MSGFVSRVGAGALAGAALSIASVAFAQPSNLDQLVIRRSSVDGRVGFVSSLDGRSPLRGADAAPVMEPGAFLSDFGPLFGIDDPAAQLHEESRRTDTIGWTTTTYHQVHEGVEVFSGVLKVHQDGAGRVVSGNGDVYEIPRDLVTMPFVSPDSAIERALFTVQFGRPEVRSIETVIVDPAWYGDPARGVRLAYHIVVADDAWAYKYALFIDAHTGELLDRWSMIHTAMNREVYDGAEGPDLPGTLARADAGPTEATGNFDIDAAFDYALDTYDYYARAFGRDSVDDAGHPLIVTAHSAATGCPNAFWNGFQTAYCTDVVADDVVAHEFTHGVTQHTSGLIYQNQSGQLNESLSDIFGELVDLFNGDAAWADLPPRSGGGVSWPTHGTGPGTDLPNTPRSGACSYAWDGYPDGVRWLVGEDALAFGGAIRDMWNPPCHADPDSANSPLQRCNVFDAGGVHSGSGVPNHAFAILCDGRDFNGVVTTGIGPIKAGAVWYRAQTTYLTVASDFQEAAWALNQSALDLVGTDPNDPRTGLPSGDPFTAADATQVANSIAATEMDSAGLCGESEDVLSAEPAPGCEPVASIFADDFESGGAGWTVFNSGPATPYDWEIASDLPFLRPGSAYFCSNGPPFFAGDETATHTLESPAIVLPPVVSFPVLEFTHHMESERRWDGGVVRIRVNGGTPQTIPAENFFFNPYNNVLLLADEGNSNPFAGSPGFTGIGGEWGTSLVHLGDFVTGGDVIEIQFVFAKDFNFGRTGWFVDDVRVYDCLESRDCNSNSVPDEFEVALGGQEVALWARPGANGNAFWSDADPAEGQDTPQVLAAQVRLAKTTTVERVRLWGVYGPDDTPPAPNFTIVIHDADSANSALPGGTLYTQSGIAATRTATGRFTNGLPEYSIAFDLDVPQTLGPGVYWFEIFDDTTGDVDAFSWSASRYSQGFWDLAFSRDVPPPAVNWSAGLTADLALELIGTPIGAVCEGDVDFDSRTTVDDLVYVIYRLGNVGARCVPGDANADGLVNTEDITKVIFFLGTCDQPVRAGG